MKKFKNLFYYLLCFIAFALTVLSLLSYFRNAESRYLKMLDFPRIQFFIASSICLVLLFILTLKWKWHTYVLMVGLILGLIINGTFLIHYTTLVPVEVPTSLLKKNSNSSLSLLLANVKMSNRQSQPLIDLIKRTDPDLVLAMEIDAWWNQNLKVLKETYPYSKHTVNEVAYGMVLYSKLPILATEVEYLNNKKVPSFQSILTLKNGQKVSLYSLHPVPPTHFEDLPDNSGQQEDAMKKLGREIGDRKFPTIVAGDLNDVVWSYVNELTGTENILFDVRVGRGFYNSYNAENFLMRWPLDHVFVTDDFQLIKIERLSKIGSDHFPILVELRLKNRSI